MNNLATLELSSIRSNQKLQSIARIMGLGLLLAMLSACGSNVTPRTNSLYSGSGPSTDISTISPAGEGQAECLPFDSTSTRLGGRVTTYYYNGVLQEDKVRVRITSLVEAFDSNAAYQIQMFRWRSTGGVTEIDSTPLQFYFEKGAGSASAISSTLTSMNATALANIRTQNSLGGSTAVDLFSKTTLVVNGVDYNWHALKIVVYNGTDVVGESNFLLLVIQANPNRYAQTHDAVLNGLHPYWSQRTLVLSESDWASRSRSYCF
ncbi:MAG: hypothetical protein RBT63_09175 [Bdellovibrionales bacterium]|jgi:hypothetical protein|nr:hypothetical protein [Bdellovibrionales bacterium]